MLTDMMPIFVTKILSMPWLEEVIMIMITACVFIATHFSIYSSKKAVPKKKSVPDDEPRRDLPVKQVRDACQAPATYVEIPGVTDSRFNGVIVSFKAQDGYGFIQCPELFDKFKRDIFLHKAQVQNFGIGSKVSFGVFISKAGQPQAKRLVAWNPTQAELEGFQAEQRQAQPWSQRQAAAATNELRWRTRAFGPPRGKPQEGAAQVAWTEDHSQVASAMPSPCRLPLPAMDFKEDAAMKMKSTLNPNAKPFVLGKDYMADLAPQTMSGQSTEPGQWKWRRAPPHEYGYDGRQAAPAKNWSSWPPEYPEGEASSEVWNNLQKNWQAAPSYKAPKWTTKEVVPKKPYWRPVANSSENIAADRAEQADGPTAQ